MTDELREIRSEAWSLLRSASVLPVRFTLFFLLLTLGLDLASALAGSYVTDPASSLSFSFVRILSLLLGAVLNAGFACYCLRVTRGEKSVSYGTLFEALPFAGKVVLLNLLQGALVGLGLSLFIIPGLVLGFSYAFALFYLCEDPALNVIEALRRSRREMQGRKWPAALLLTSFWPLALAVALCALCVEYALPPLLPDSLAGSLLFTLLSDTLCALPELVLLPWAGLSMALFFRRAVRAREAEEESWGPEV